MFNILLYVVIFVTLPNVINCEINLCGDWTQYGDKCIKVIEKKATQEEALINCTQLEQTSTLLTIQSKEEQEFLNKLLLKYNNYKNCWIGMEYKNKTYQWIDGTVVNYTNWDAGAVMIETDPCVQMSLVNDVGKWTDMSCNRTALIVCEKKQVLNFNILKDILESQQSTIEKLSKAFDVFEKATVPIGFLYTQFPNQSSPQQLWPNLKWSEVTQQYAGLFFRAEGSDSAPFGQIQQANQSWISDIKAESYDDDGTIKKGYKGHAQLSQGNWTTLYSGWWMERLHFYRTFGENRPRNTAIKMWKRIN